MRCPRCGGNGLCVECNGDGALKCSTCAGRGSIKSQLPSGVIVESKCSRCSGDGWNPCNKECEVCNGTGVFVPDLKRFEKTKDHNDNDNEILIVFKPAPPVATYTILIGIVIATLLSGALVGKLNIFYQLGAFFPPFVEQGQVWRFVTAMFLHGNFLHLFFNAYCLFILCPSIERIINVPRFLLLYFMSGIAGFALSMIMYPDTPTVGASGALFGIMASYLGLQARNHIFNAEVIKQLTFWFVLNMILGIFVPNINIWAHVGGAITGFLYAYSIKKV